jgi:AraC-like DNA-binding protein
VHDTPVAVERLEISTADLAEALDFLGGGVSAPHPPSAPFHFRAVLHRAGSLTVSDTTLRAAVRLSVPASTSVAVSVVVAGNVLLRPPGREDRIGVGEAARDPLGVPFDVEADRLEARTVRFPLATAARVAARLGGDPADFRFDDAVRPRSPGMQRHWMATAVFVHRAFAGPDPAVGHALLRLSVEETAATAAVAAFPNTAMTLDEPRGPGRTAPAVVRRAATYIETHAGEPITVEDVAVAAGVGVRGLQAAFARHRDTTPTGYLRRVRLERAHHDLLTGDPSRGDTVTGVARRWGFADPGRFARAYRRAYGRPPGETLRA